MGIPYSEFKKIFPMLQRNFVSSGIREFNCQRSLLYARHNTIYIGFDYQSGAMDTPVLVYSHNGGISWSKPVALARPQAHVPHIMVTVAGVSPESAYVTWMTTINYSGWSIKLAKFSTDSGEVSRTVTVSQNFGLINTWGGDTTGLSYLGGNSLEVSWGYGIFRGGDYYNSQIYAEHISFNEQGYWGR